MGHNRRLAPDQPEYLCRDKEEMRRHQRVAHQQQGKDLQTPNQGRDQLGANRCK